MQQPAVGELLLVREPVAALLARLRELLEDWPGNPMLEQLIAICSRLLGALLTSNRSMQQTKRQNIGQYAAGLQLTPSIFPHSCEQWPGDAGLPISYAEILL